MSVSDAGALLRHFYATGPVCSPTRGTCLTGRHYYRYGIFKANVGHLPAGEITIARLLKEQDYTTGHFGKWHLGTLSKTHSTKGAALSAVNQTVRNTIPLRPTRVMIAMSEVRMLLYNQNVQDL